MNRSMLISRSEPACSLGGQSSLERCTKRPCSFSAVLHPRIPATNRFDGILQTRPAGSKLLVPAMERLTRPTAYAVDGREDMRGVNG